MNKVTVSAPGKLMLFGEHAVVYGYPCIVSAVDQRLTLVIEEIKQKRVEIDAPQVKNIKFIDSAIEAFIHKFKIRPDNIKIRTNCNFSGKYGFGSSAAVTVATLFALVKFYNQDVSKSELFNLAYQCVLQVQQVGSGFDVAAAIWGGTLFFIKAGQKTETMPLVKPLPIVVGYTGIKSNTVDIVKQVVIKQEQHPHRINQIFCQIGELVNQAKQELLTGNWPKLGKLMNQDQELLDSLGVSCDMLDKLIIASRNAGAWGAKLSGAGGGDCMVALVDNERRSAVEKAIAQAGGEVLPVKLDTERVKIEYGI